MRTTLEIRDEHRARLLELAALRGEKGFSRLVEEAIDLYLKRQDERREAVRRALATRGSLTAAEVADLESEVRRVREHWR